jgi:hypothetical protein
MTILWELDEKHPKQLSAYGTMPWVTFSRPCGIALWHRQQHLIGGEHGMMTLTQFIS